MDNIDGIKSSVSWLQIVYTNGVDKVLQSETVEMDGVKFSIPGYCWRQVQNFVFAKEENENHLSQTHRRTEK